MCETCGNAWARAPQLSVTHLEDFYFFMDCTGHEIIISSAPHHKPHQLETALCSIQPRLWTLPLAQGHGPLLGHDFREGHKLAKSRLVARQHRNVRNMWQRKGERTAIECNSSRRLLFFMDCTSHEVITSSAPHHKPHQLETALCSIQARLWTLPLAQGHGPLLGHDFRGSHKLAR